MAKIELLLGDPTTEEREDEIEEVIYNLDINSESAVILRVKMLIKWLSGVNEDNKNYLNWVASDDIDHSVQLPIIGFGVYRECGYVLPKMIINGFNLVSTETGDKYFISNRIIDVIGRYIEDVFEFEYRGFQRVGKVIPSKSDVIYHLGDRPYIYHSGQFIAAVQRR